jgi:hypothetical protein
VFKDWRKESIYNSDEEARSTAGTAAKIEAVVDHRDAAEVSRKKGSHRETDPEIIRNGPALAMARNGGNDKSTALPTVWLIVSSESTTTRQKHRS